MSVTAAAMDLVRQYEGLRLETYRDPVGVLTIGYGHTAEAGPPEPLIGMRITAEDAAWILARDLDAVAAAIRPLIAVPLSATQFGALVSFAFNVGIGAFADSTLRRQINTGQLDAVPAELMRWVHGGRPQRVLPGLRARREAEGRLWLTA